jgi:hypothetical protein
LGRLFFLSLQLARILHKALYQKRYIIDSMSATAAKCLDCGKPYSEFGLDMILPDDQWQRIHPEKDGLLCASCIVKRASQLPNAVVVSAVIECVPTVPPAVKRTK